MDHILPNVDPLKGILKKANNKPKSAMLKWDEENLRITELQKDSQMKITEPKTPYIHYDMDQDTSLQDLDDLQLSPRSSSRASSISSSPKKTSFAVADDWDSADEQMQEQQQEDRGIFPFFLTLGFYLILPFYNILSCLLPDFAKLRSLHYQNEGAHVSKKRDQFWDIQNGKFVVEKDFTNTTTNKLAKNASNSFNSSGDIKDISDSSIVDPNDNYEQDNFNGPAPTKESSEDLQHKKDEEVIEDNDSNGDDEDDDTDDNDDDGDDDDSDDDDDQSSSNVFPNGSALISQPNSGLERKNSNPLSRQKQEQKMIIKNTPSFKETYGSSSEEEGL
ncbi:Protein phosphatase inhibitor 2 [Smittium mucronatum]|uniref:Protein phosphatase inhibitor 2 n=1 Tax=Smittium mucronatum TaxID=133383 RepID=A0A1R0H465_9FUNG|nr:Protein phosphatase inhibitor 2 [Smittium mucronatum]